MDKIVEDSKSNPDGPRKTRSSTLVDRLSAVKARSEDIRSERISRKRTSIGSQDGDVKTPPKSNEDTQGAESFDIGTPLESMDEVELRYRCKQLSETVESLLERKNTSDVGTNTDVDVAGETVESLLECRKNTSDVGTNTDVDVALEVIAEWQSICEDLLKAEKAQLSVAKVDLQNLRKSECPILKKNFPLQRQAHPQNHRQVSHLQRQVRPPSHRQE